MVMERCTAANTREQFFRTFNNRAYPANDLLLRKLIELRHELATLLGFASYAELNLADSMAQQPERARKFLQELLIPIREKSTQELAKLRQHLHPSVKLSPEGKFQPWDLNFSKSHYKQTQQSLDEVYIAEFFPMDSTIKGLLKIYETFFSLSFVEVPASELAGKLWHPDVRLIEVYTQDKTTLIGYLFLDLHPRPHKYSHACEMNIIPAWSDEAMGKNPPAVAVVIANFTQPTDDQPALWKRTSEVSTFFHEFGHALHDLLGRSALAGSAGTRVKRDFVELPSQMLEEWLKDRAILKQLSCHYKTGECLPDELISRIINAENDEIGTHLQRQISFALLALNYYQPGATKDPDVIMRAINTEIISYVVDDPTAHMYASFGHLTGYGAQYYGYLWSQVYALDLFDTIKQHGLLDPHIGERYVSCILRPGGSKDPNKLLEEFLGRQPTITPFLAQKGLLP